MPHRHPLSTNRYTSPSSSTGTRGREYPRTTLTTPAMAAAAAAASGGMAVSPPSSSSRLSSPTFASPFALRLSKYSSPHRWIRAPGGGVDVRVHVEDRNQDINQHTSHSTPPFMASAGKSSIGNGTHHGSLASSSSSYDHQFPLQPEVCCCQLTLLTHPHYPPSQLTPPLKSPYQHFLSTRLS